MDYQLLTPLSTQELSLSAVERVFLHRGLSPEQSYHYLHTTDKDILDPSSIKNIDIGAKMLISHISKNDDIFIQVDSDQDGFTSAAILINYLYSLFPSYTQNHVIYRLHEGKEHGIIPETIPPWIGLVIIPDAGSNQIEEHKQLKEFGYDILVIDHHIAEQESPYACIINNQMCDYQSKSLSGAGMVYKFCSYIDKCLGISNADNYLDLAAVGCIGDMVSLKDYELKRIIDKGLSNVINPFLKGLINIQSYSIERHGGLDPYAVSFYITPQVNATIRVGEPEEKQLLFDSMIEYKAYNLIPSTKRGCKGQQETLVDQACRNCANIKNRQNKIQDENLEGIERIIEQKNLTQNKVLAVKVPDTVNLDTRLTGLIANKIMGKYKQPTLILHLTSDEDGNQYWTGSGRAPGQTAFENFRSFIENSQLAEYSQGHESAFGTQIAANKFNDFINYSNEQLKDIDFSPNYKVDFIYQSNNFNGNDIIKIAELKSIFGQDLETPYIAIENINITKDNIQLLSPDKNPTLKINLSNGTSLIKFKSSIEEYNNLYSEVGSVKINIVGTCERNIWNGNITPQVIVEDYDITDRVKYYF